MKSVIIIAFLLTFCFSMPANAQSFSLLSNSNQTLNNGDTLTFTTNTNDLNLLEGKVKVQNIASTTKSVMIQRDLLSLVPGCDNAFAFGLMMYPPSINLTPNGFDITSATTDSSFVSWFNHYGIAGTSYIKYTFFDELNPNDNAWVILKFEITQAAGISNLYSQPNFDFFPNPAKDLVTVIFNESLQLDNTFEITDQSGKLIQQLSISQLATQIDFTNFNPGIYYMTRKSEIGKLKSAVKFIKL